MCRSTSRQRKVWRVLEIIMLFVLVFLLTGAAYPLQLKLMGSMPSPIDEKYAALGGSIGFLGIPKSEEIVAPDGIGHYRHFQGGSIYWTPQTNAHEVHGAIRDKWASLGWERGWLGYPKTDEVPGPDGVIRFNHFQGGSIYWVPFAGGYLSSYGQLGPGSHAFNIGDKFNNTMRNDDGTMSQHLKMYKDNVVVYGVLLEDPHVNFPSDAEQSYSNFISAPWWFQNRCQLSKDHNCGDDPPDGDLDFRIRIDRPQLDAQPGFWTEGWVFHHGENRPSQIKAKLDNGDNEVEVEVIMYGRSAKRGGGRNVSLPLLPGWAESSVTSVLLDGQPINGGITFGQELGNKEAYLVDKILGKELRQGTQVKITGFLALDCHSGNCNEDEPGNHNVEIHPAYSIDIIT